MLKDHSGCNDNGSEKESREFVAILRGVIRGRKLKGRKLVDELLGHPLFIRRLRSICYSLTGNHTNAEDLLNEICLKLCSPPKKGRRRKIRLRQFKPDWQEPYGNFFGWLRQVSRHVFF
jgi:DNA-directed RNA polymerase specialized sigma24 family protein